MRTFLKITVQIVIACKKILYTQKPSNILFFDIIIKRENFAKIYHISNVLLAKSLIYEMLLQFLLLILTLLSNGDKAVNLTTSNFSE